MYCHRKLPQRRPIVLILLAQNIYIAFDYDYCNNNFIVIVLLQDNDRSSKRAELDECTAQSQPHQHTRLVTYADTNIGLS